jgi:hypothetical protein
MGKRQNRVFYGRCKAGGADKRISLLALWRAPDLRGKMNTNLPFFGHADQAGKGMFD